MLELLPVLLLLAMPEGDDGSCYQSEPGPDSGFRITGKEDGLRNCVNLFYCEAPELGQPRYEAMGGCNPAVQSCTVRASVPSVFPGNAGNTFGSASVVVTRWWTPSVGATLRGGCGSFGNQFLSENGEAWIEIGFSCAAPGSSPWAGEYKLEGVACFGASCEVTRTVDVHLTGPELSARLCPPPPPEDDCDDEVSCQLCKSSGGGIGGGSASAAGSGGTAGGPGTGPGARLRYKAGGIGHPQLPGSTFWTTELGRYWSHDYAERIFVDSSPSPAASQVYLVTASGVYRTFADMGGDGLYEERRPASVYDRLEDAPGGGWTLTSLDGTVKIFDSGGRWLSTSDRFGNTKSATYITSRLSQVDFPDGRHEELTYHLSGKLATLTEVGIDGTTSRTWSYSWTGDDLTRIDLPDGRALEYFYGDGSHPGFMTRTELVGEDGISRRVTAAWEYDTPGNVVKIWKGSASFVTGVEKWQFAFDDPLLPRETSVTDPLGNTAIYQLDTARGSRTEKAKLIELEGDCPSCGTGPNSELFYTDSANPFRVTREINGRGYETRSSWSAEGRLEERIEAFGTAVERTTSYTYDPTFPALWTSVEQPSTTGVVTDFRRTKRSYDGMGRLTAETVEGIEATVPFSLATAYTPTTEGLPGTIDPPGYGTTDQSSFVYDSARGNLVPTNRTDPEVGTTSFGYDPFNRRTSVTDVNGVVTETAYDDGDRVLAVIAKGATMAGDEVTESRYNTYGDLFQKILPEGNVVEYGYDAAGRLVSVERKADDQPTTHGERTFYTLNGAGQRIKEERQRWSGSAWVTVGQNRWVYSSRCHLDESVAGLPGEESVTEQAYDCNGNVSKVWDANHPSASQTATPSTSYTYDELDRLVLSRQPFGGAGGGNADTAYEYDVQDHLVEVRDANGTVTNYTYSDRDLMTREISEVSGTTNYTYNEHGQLTFQLDARGISTSRAVDAIDRVTSIDLPGSDLDVAYTFDDPLVPFSIGRLTSITRGWTRVDYAYDRFGRTIQDGGIGYTFDKNGNAETMTYPGGLVANYTYDYADRPATLSATPAGGSPQAIVTAATYRPFAKASSLTLGNGLTETRDYDSREFPERILVPGKLDWQYTVDDVGNPTAIDDNLVQANDKTYAYQDYQYFLTTGNGPWGTRGWTYDKIGNRLTEARGSVTDTYAYVANAVAGRSPKIQQITLSSGGTRIFTYDSAGNEIQAGSSIRTFDAAGRLGSQSNSPAQAITRFTYDGRGFLAEAVGTAPTGIGSGIFCDGFESGSTSAWGGTGSACFERIATRPTYGSDQRLYQVSRAALLSDVLYFRTKPVAIITHSSDGTAYTLVSSDHLGTPVLITSNNAAVIWSGGLEPFGKDWNGASTASNFLRFPGQWDDVSWSASSADTKLVDNVYRWHSPTTGSYVSPDTWSGSMGSWAFGYSYQNPIKFYDSLGLFAIDPNCDVLNDICAPTGNSLLQQLQREAKNACETTYKGVFDRSLQRCIKKRCNSYRISCDGPQCGPTSAGAYTYPGSRVIYLCTKTLGGPASAPQIGWLDQTLVHELAHTCGWEHLDGKGVPGVGPDGQI